MQLSSTMCLQFGSSNNYRHIAELCNCSFLDDRIPLSAPLEYIANKYHSPVVYTFREFNIPFF